MTTSRQIIEKLEALTWHELRHMIIVLCDYEIPRMEAAITAALAWREYEEELARRTRARYDQHERTGPVRDAPRVP